MTSGGKRRKKKNDAAKKAASDARAAVLPGVARKYAAEEDQLRIAHDKMVATADLGAATLGELVGATLVPGYSTVHRARDQLDYAVQRARLAVSRAAALLRLSGDGSGALRRASASAAELAAAPHMKQHEMLMGHLRKLNAQRKEFGTATHEKAAAATVAVAAAGQRAAVAVASKALALRDSTAAAAESVSAAAEVLRLRKQLGLARTSLALLREQSEAAARDVSAASADMWQRVDGAAREQTAQRAECDGAVAVAGAEAAVSRAVRLAAGAGAAAAASLAWLREKSAAEVRAAAAVSALAHRSGGACVARLPAVVTEFSRRRRSLRQRLVHLEQCAAAARAAAAGGVMGSAVAHAAERSAARALAADVRAIALSGASAWAVSAREMRAQLVAEEASLASFLQQPQLSGALQRAAPPVVVKVGRSCGYRWDEFDQNDRVLKPTTFHGWSVDDSERLAGGSQSYQPAGGFIGKQKWKKPSGVLCTCVLPRELVPHRVFEQLSPGERRTSSSGHVKVLAISVSGLVARRFFRVERPYKKCKSIEAHTTELPGAREGKWACVRMAGQGWGSAAIGFIKLGASAKLAARNLVELSKDERVCVSLDELRIICKAKAPVE
jgi:hypothetical protein